MTHATHHSPNPSQEPEQALTRSLTAFAVPGFPLVKPGMDLATVIADAVTTGGFRLIDGDVLVIAQKVVSKSEDCYVDLSNVRPRKRAKELGTATGKDPRLVEVILSESRRVVRHRFGVLIVEHRLGFVLANAGVDQSNVDPAVGSEPVLLLPKDPDESAVRLRSRLAERFKCDLAVVISDSFGRAWRLGTAGVALGAAGLPALVDLRGKPDLYDRRLRVSEVGFADEIASAASLLMGQADEGCPVVILRGLRWTAPTTPASKLLRSADQDLFR